MWKLAGTILAFALALWWAWGFFHNGFPGWTAIVEAAGLLIIGLSLGGPLVALGLFIVGGCYRSIFRSPLHGYLPALAFTVAVIVGEILSGHVAGIIYGGYSSVQIVGILGSGIISRLLSVSLVNQDDWLDHQRLLTRGGAALMAAGNRDAILDVGLASALRIAGGDPQLSAFVALPAEGALRAVRARGASAVALVGQPVDARSGIPLGWAGPRFERTVVPLGGAEHEGILVIIGLARPAAERAETLKALGTLLTLRLEAHEELRLRHEAAEARAAALAEANQFKDDLLERVSHELRTPLTSIRSYAELLLDYADPEVQREFLTIIRSESQRLSRLVNDMLDLTKVQKGALTCEREPVDVRSIVEEAGQIFEPLARQQGLDFTVDVDEGVGQILADRDRMLQVLSNLLGNALKFTPSGRIRLNASRAQGEVRITVQDSGVGVPAEERERVFEKFRQLESLPGAVRRGTGLGLAICRELVEQHQGRIWVEPAPLGGSLFVVSLPAIREAPVPA